MEKGGGGGRRENGRKPSKTPSVGLEKRNLCKASPAVFSLSLLPFPESVCVGNRKLEFITCGGGKAAVGKNSRKKGREREGESPTLH